MSFVLLIVGIGLLYAGGELLVRSAGALAARFGISPLVIGLTVVAFGTSAPELAATVAASLRGVPDLGVGNVLGSNIANVGLILGLAALLAPIAGSASFLRREIPVVLAVMLLLVPLAWDGTLGRWDGALLIALLAGYLVLMVRQDRSVVDEALSEGAERVPPWRGALGAAAGVTLLVLGAEALVRGGVEIATALGVPEQVIGLTMVAFGTSLPELASSVVAAARGEGEMILGNIAGSNVFNVLAVFGATSLITPLPVALSAVRFDLGVALAFSAALIPLMGLRAGLGRGRGGLLLGAYLAYVVLAFV